MFIEIDNLSINYEWVNYQYINIDKPLLVFLHQGLGSVGMWKDYPDLLSERLRLPVLLYDRYGHGRSSQRTHIQGLKFLESEADFLSKFLDALRLNNKEYILYGHSDGGTIALIHAAKYPEQVLAIITEAAHVINEEITREAIKQLAGQFKNDLLKEKLERYHGDNTEILFNNWSNAWLDKDTVSWNISSYLEQIKAPVYAIQGKNDPFGSYKQLEILAEKANAKTCLIDHCAHIPHKEQKEKVVSMVEHYIKQLQKRE